MAKILNIISDTNIGGAGRSLLNYLAYCDRERFPSSVVLPRGSELKVPIEELGAEVCEIDAMADKSMDPKAIAPLCRVIREMAPDLVHAHGSLVGRMAAKLCGKKVIYTKHCAFDPQGLRSGTAARIGVRVLDILLSDGVIAIGPSAKKTLMLEGIPEGKIYELFNGVASLRSPAAEERAEARAQFGIKPDDFVVGMLARMEPYKGQEYLLDAAQILRQKGKNVKLFLVGDGSDRDRLLERGKALGEEAVIFPGFMSDVERALWCMDVQVNASTESETSSLSLLEGMSIGLPAVVSDVGGNPCLIADGENGFVFPNRDAAALANAIERLMEDPQRCAAIGARAREIYHQRFTGEIYAKNIENVYHSVLKGSK